MKAEDSSKFLSFIQQPLRMQLEVEKHRVGGHHYPVYVIQLAIRLLIQSFTSLRGVEKTLDLFADG